MSWNRWICLQRTKASLLIADPLSCVSPLLVGALISTILEIPVPIPNTEGVNPLLIGALISTFFAEKRSQKHD